MGENFTPHLGAVKNRPKNAEIKKKKRHETLKQGCHEAHVLNSVAVYWISVIAY